MQAWGALSNTAENTVKALSKVPRSFHHLSHVAVVATLLGAHAPLLLLHFGNLWWRPHYRFWPFLLIVVVYLSWKRWPRRTTQDLTRPRSTLAILAAALLILAVAVGLHCTTLAMIAAILTTGAIFSCYAGRAFRADLLGRWALLWLLALPLFDLDFWISDGLP